MIKDIDLLKLMMNRHNFDNYRLFVQEETIEQETGTLLEDFAAYFERYKEDVEVELKKFVTFFYHLRHPDFKKDDKELFNTLLVILHNHELTEAAEDLLNKLKSLALGEELLKVSKDNPSFDAYTEVLDKHLKKERGNVDQLEFVPMDINLALEETNPETGYHWRLAELNQVVGLMSPWTFGIVAASTNSGKSSFLVSEISYLCQQLKEDETILWLNNENKGIRIVPRLYTAMFNIRRDELEENREHYITEFAKMGGNKIQILDIQKQNNRYIEKIVRQLKPRIVLIDMLDNVYGFSYNKNETQEIKYERLYQWALELSCMYNCTVIGTSQLNVLGTHKAYPDITNLKGSNGPSKQGAASWVMMLGRTQGQQYENVRFFSAPKSKFGDDTFRAEVQFDREKGVFYSATSPWRIYEGA